VDSEWRLDGQLGRQPVQGQLGLATPGRRAIPVRRRVGAPLSPRHQPGRIHGSVDPGRRRGGDTAMKHSFSSAALALTLAAISSLPAPAAEMKKNITIDPSNFQRLKSLFGAYPPGTEYVLFGGEDLRLRLPEGVEGIPQTGVYSLFALTGDCEVTVAYELLKLQPPRSGYGSGFGLAVDGGAQVGRGEIKLADKTPEGSGYWLQTSLAKGGKEMKQEYKFTPATVERGRIGVRRVNKDLVFLAADDLEEPLKEL